MDLIEAHTTLKKIVENVQNAATSDREVVAVLTHLFGTGRIRVDDGMQRRPLYQVPLRRTSMLGQQNHR